VEQVLHSFEVGDAVRAARVIFERDFGGCPFHVHAEPGEMGWVQIVDGNWLTVTWAREGTTTDCHVSELAMPAPAREGEGAGGGSEEGGLSLSSVALVLRGWSPRADALVARTGAAQRELKTLLSPTLQRLRARYGRQSGTDPRGQQREVH
jgi:hypothetical protein